MISLLRAIYAACVLFVLFSFACLLTGLLASTAVKLFLIGYRIWS